MIGRRKVIKGHRAKKNISHEFNGLGEIRQFGGLDKNLQPNSGAGAGKLLVAGVLRSIEMSS